MLQVKLNLLSEEFSLTTLIIKSLNPAFFYIFKTISAPNESNLIKTKTKIITKNGKTRKPIELSKYKKNSFYLLSRVINVHIALHLHTISLCMHRLATKPLSLSPTVPNIAFLIRQTMSFRVLNVIRTFDASNNQLSHTLTRCDKLSLRKCLLQCSTEHKNSPKNCLRNSFLVISATKYTLSFSND